jgi:molybdopterin/thiamine biosynthesis adenylyltransferase
VLEVHGALAGFMGQVMTVLPGDQGLKDVYGEGRVQERGAEQDLGAPGVTPMAVAACQASEAMKIMLGWEPALRGRLLVMDLKNMANDLIGFRA